MIFYYHYIGDYARDTGTLTVLEHGVYRLLLDHCYATEAMPPNDSKELYRIAKAMTPAERKAVDKIADKFFPVNGDGRRHHKRVQEEIEKAQQAMEGDDERKKNERERQRRHRERRSKLFEELRAVGVIPNFDTTAEDLERLLSDARHASGDVTVTPPVTRDITATKSQSQNQSQGKSTTSAANAAEARGAAATVPDCPHEKLIALFHELLPGSPRVEKWTTARQASMRARWRDEARPNREKHRGYSTEEAGLGYWRRFFAYCAESKFLTGRAPGRDGKPPFLATLPWLLKAENFAKVIEGTYHRDPA